MYRQNELLEKVKDHLKENKIKLLEALIKDVDEFNDKYTKKGFEIYIDFDNVGDGSEFDPYETFSIRLRYKSSEKYIESNVHDLLDIRQLDDCLCTLCCYFEEVECCTKKLDEESK